MRLSAYGTSSMCAQHANKSVPTHVCRSPCFFNGMLPWRTDRIGVPNGRLDGVKPIAHRMPRWWKSICSHCWMTALKLRGTRASIRSRSRSLIIPRHQQQLAFALILHNGHVYRKLYSQAANSQFRIKLTTNCGEWRYRPIAGRSSDVHIVRSADTSHCA